MQSPSHRDQKNQPWHASGVAITIIIASLIALIVLVLHFIPPQNVVSPPVKSVSTTSASAARVSTSAITPPAPLYSSPVPASLQSPPDLSHPKPNPGLDIFDPNTGFGLDAASAAAFRTSVANAITELKANDIINLMRTFVPPYELQAWEQELKTGTIRTDVNTGVAEYLESLLPPEQLNQIMQEINVSPNDNDLVRSLFARSQAVKPERRDIASGVFLRELEQLENVNSLPVSVYGDGTNPQSIMLDTGPYDGQVMQILVTSSDGATVGGKPGFMFNFVRTNGQWYMRYYP